MKAFTSSHRSHFQLLCICFSLLLGAGCKTNRALPDGFYFLDETGQSQLRIVAKDGRGTSHDLAIRKVQNLQVIDIFVYSLLPQEVGFQVQVNLRCLDTNWSACLPILVVDSKPYIELSRTEGKAVGDTGMINISPSISLKVQSESEANLIRNRLVKLSAPRVP